MRFGGKILCLQRLEFHPEGHLRGKPTKVEVRLGYYIIGKKPKMRGKWVWGQFAALMPIKDFRHLVREAKKRGWI